MGTIELIFISVLTGLNLVALYLNYKLEEKNNVLQEKVDSYEFEEFKKISLEDLENELEIFDIK